MELKKVKAQAVRLCGQLGLDNLKKSVSGAKGINLEVFFTVKTHKVLRPFRAIVTQKDSKVNVRQPSAWLGIDMKRKIGTLTKNLINIYPTFRDQP